MPGQELKVSLAHTDREGTPRTVVRYETPLWSVDIPPAPMTPDGPLALWARLEKDAHRPAVQALERLWQQALQAHLPPPSDDDEEEDSAAPRIEELRRRALDALIAAVREAFVTGPEEIHRHLAAIGLEEYPQADCLAAPALAQGTALRPIATEALAEGADEDHLDEPWYFEAEGGWKYKIVRSGKSDRPFSGTRCTVERRGIGLRCEGSVITVLPAEISAYRGQGATELDRLINRVLEEIPALASQVHQAASGGADDPGKLARVASVLRNAHRDLSVPVTVLDECLGFLEEYARSRSWDILYGHAGFCRALDLGYDAFDAVLARPEAHLPQDPDVELLHGDNAVFVVTHDGSVSVWPAPLRVLVRCSLSQAVLTYAPELAERLARVLTRGHFAGGQAPAKDVQQELERILVGLGPKFWAPIRPERSDEILDARTAFARLCSQWIEYECRVMYDGAHRDSWHVEEVDELAPEGQSHVQVLAPALIPFSAVGEVYPGRVKMWRKRPPWLGSLRRLAGEWPWGTLDGGAAPDDLRKMPGPFREHFAELLRDPPDVPAARRAVDAVLDVIDERGGALHGDESRAASAFREDLLMWAAEELTAGLASPEEFLDSRHPEPEAVAMVALPDDTPPRPGRYVRFAEPRIEVLYGRDWTEARYPEVLAELRGIQGVNAERIERALIQQVVMPLSEEALAGLTEGWEALDAGVLNVLAAALRFETRLPWVQKQKTGWTWFGLAPEALTLYDVPGGTPADPKAPGEWGIGWTAAAEPVLDGRRTLVRTTPGGAFLLRGTLNGLALPLPRRLDGPADILERLAGGPEPCGQVAAEIERLALALATGRITIEGYAASALGAYKKITLDAAPPEAAGGRVEDVRHAVAGYLGGRIIPRRGPGGQSSELLAAGAPVELAGRPPGDVVRVGHPFGGIAVDRLEAGLYEEDVVYAVGGPLVQAAEQTAVDAADFSARAASALRTLREAKDPVPLAALFAELSDAGCPPDVVRHAQSDLGYSPALAEPLEGEVSAAPEGCRLVWVYAAEPARHAVEVDRGLRYGAQLLREPVVHLSRGPEPARLRAVLSDGGWTAAAAPWRNELLRILDCAAAPDAGPEWSGKVGERLLRLLDTLWRDALDKAGALPECLADLAGAARADGVLDAELGAEIETDRSLADVPADRVAWQEVEVAAQAEPVRAKRIRFGVRGPAAFARAEVYVPVVSDDVFGRAAAGLLKGGTSPDVLLPFFDVAAGQRLAVLREVVSEGRADAPATVLAKLAGALGAALEPAACVGRILPAAIREAEFDELGRLGEVRVDYLIEEPAADTFQVVEVRRYGLRAGPEWVVEPSLGLQTSRLPEWARIARACEVLVQGPARRRAYREAWSAWLGTDADPRNALSEILDAAGRAYRAELLVGEPETGHTVYDHLLSAQEYQKRYAAFTRTLDGLGVPVEKLLYRSQLVRRLVHVDPNAPSNEKPVLWSMQLSPSGTGMVLRFASAVKSR